MKQLSKLYVAGILLISLSGCMTFSGDKLAELEPLKPLSAPRIEESVGNFTFHLDGGQMVTDNKMGRMINDAILEKWKKKRYISKYDYVKSEKFTNKAQYNLTLKGHQEGESSVFMQIISGLTLLIFPHTIDTTFDLVYELENVITGKKYSVKVSDSFYTVNWLLFFPALPFSFIGADATYNRIAEHVYQGFEKQGAFTTEPASNP